MKKLITLTAIAMFGICLVSSAQTDSLKKKYVIPKGSKIMTGSISGSYTKRDDNHFEPLKRTGSASITEQSGYFVSNNLSVGLLLGYSFSFHKYVEPLPAQPYTFIRNDYSHTISPGIFIRYYKMFTQKFGIMGQFNASCLINFSNVWSNNPIYTTRDQYIGANANISPRLVYFITPKLGVEAGFGSIGYNFLQDINSGKNTHGGGFALNPDLHLGLSFYLGKGVQPK